jgi:hypothetical protein
MVTSSGDGVRHFLRSNKLPNARRELRLEAGATQERTLEAVSSRPGVRRQGRRGKIQKIPALSFTTSELLIKHFSGGEARTVSHY